MRRLLMILVVLACVGNTPLSAQQKKKTPETVESLNKRIAKTNEEIRIAEQLLSKNKKDQKVTRNNLSITEVQISKRQEVVDDLNRQIAIIEQDVRDKNKNISELEKKLAQLKKDYADMIRAAYKGYKQNNSMVFIFASRDFNDMTRRIDYMRRCNNVREENAAQIEVVSDSLSVEVDNLQAQRAQLEKTKKNRDKELSKLKSERAQYAKDTKTLQQNEKKLKDKIKAKETEKSKAESRLKSILAAEAKKTAVAKRTAAEEKHIAELSGRFDQNKGKLPYPVKGGVVIDKFGQHKHPTQKNLVINNIGVKIAAEKAASVNCVFEGVVVKTGNIKGLNNYVMVRHGEYLTCYANLGDILVAENDKVKLNQPLGTLPRTDDSEDYFLQFMLSKGTTWLNPEQWFYR